MSSPAFRKIRSQGQGESSGSTSNPNNQSTPESTTGSDPRLARGESSAATTGSTSKRRRVPDTVTRNACQLCKKARSKCDGETPCERCTTRGEECVYERHVKYAKEELVKDIRELRVGKNVMERIFEALSNDEKVPEVLDRLRSRETYESIVKWLGPSHAHGLGRSPELETLSPRESHHSAFEGSDHEMEGVSQTPFRWTVVTSNQAIINHLFQLYFAWVHPVHTLFSEGHFTDSFTRHTDTYCASVLVNAICAMACHLHSAAERDEIDFDQLGSEFSEAVRADIVGEDKNKATTIQAFAVMFLVDCARSNVPRAAAYLKLATGRLRSIASQDNEGHNEVLKTTVRGIRSLNVFVLCSVSSSPNTNVLSEWAQATFQVPPIITSAPFEDMEDYDDELDQAPWYYYRYVNDTCPAWPGLLATTNREKLKLVNIINDATTLMYASHGARLSANDILRLYGRFVTWREELPDSIGNIEVQKSQALPHVLSLLILYSNAVIQLLRPLLDYEGFPSSLVEEITWKTAQEGLFLLDKHYRTQYTCRYQPVLQMFGVLQLSDVICRFFPNGDNGAGKDGASAVQFGLEVLIQSYVGFPVAGPFQEMLRRTANDCSISLPKYISDHLATPRPPKQRYGMDDLIDACSRLSYVQPTEEIHIMYLPSFSVDWASNASAYGFHEPSAGRRLRVPSAEEKSAQTLMQISNLLNAS
ncbi:Nitrogen assimilation transcription factor nirA [Hyphodiscus hymeniophilus]|uniref:Nitrogen assimilation transcription factor nirA n=1 Tax=Hyphodiscus hymeniophilus TaxID=353542 RepID=A0A9P7AXR4_9HELO|nr:Nitrogen assimilation transcription factor nirA [Hyphodiscus hymeniophilus]